MSRKKINKKSKKPSYKSPEQYLLKQLGFSDTDLKIIEMNSKGKELKEIAEELGMGLVEVTETLQTMLGKAYGKNTS